MLTLETKHDAAALAPASHRDLTEWLRLQAQENKASALGATDAWGEQVAFDAAKKLREAADIIEGLAQAGSLSRAPVSFAPSAFTLWRHGRMRSNVEAALPSL